MQKLPKDWITLRGFIVLCLQEFECISNQYKPWLFLSLIIDKIVYLIEFVFGMIVSTPLIIYCIIKITVILISILSQKVNLNKQENKKEVR